MGSLFHSTKFEVEMLVDSNGIEREEVIATSNNLEVVAWSSWTEVKQEGLKYGIPIDSWPEFKEEFDLDLNWMRDKNKPLRISLQNSQVDASEADSWFARIKRYFLSGEDIFFVY